MAKELGVYYKSHRIYGSPQITKNLPDDQKASKACSQIDEGTRALKCQGNMAVTNYD